MILANPPFMSPKGGIRPHNRFQVQSKRSEVLFVDYIAEHLTPQGRAAIIVPEGIVFQSQGAYCALRKLLVDKFLIAVVSLPAGVFNPYSGVKTSILILDRAAAKASDRVAFFKIENDGFGLGAQRRAVKGSQLPQVTTELGAWLAAVRGGGDAVIESALGFAVERARIADGGEYNLAGERYGATKERTSNWPMVRLGDLVSSKSGNSTIIKGTLPTEPGDGLYSAYSATGQDVFAPTFAHEGPGIVISAVGARCGKCFRADGKWQPIANTHAMIADEKVALTDYLFLFLNNENFWVKGGSAQPFVKVKASLEIKIPLPPLEVQRGIVAEIEGYQRVIDGAHAVLDNYRPHIPIDPAWEMAPIGDFILSSGVGLVKNKGEQHDSFAHPYLKMNNIMIEGLLNFAKVDRVEAGPNELARYALDDGDFIYNTRNSPELVGKSAVYHGPSGQILFNNNILRIKFDHRLHSDYVNWILNSAAGKKKIRSLVDGTTSVAALYQRNFETIEIPLPPLETQQAIVAEIEAEQALVAANRELVARFETKIETAIARVWGEAKAVSGAEGALATQSELEPA